MNTKTLSRSVAHPHPETAEIEKLGLSDWGDSLPKEDGSLVDMTKGTRVRWVEGVGWLEESD